MAAFVLLPCLLGCRITPAYKMPDVPVPPSYKASVGTAAQGSVTWQPAQPADSLHRGDWWLIFNDPALDALEKQIDVSNQSIAVAAANYAAARALVREAHAQYFPTASAGAAVNYARASVVPAVKIASGVTYTEYSVPVQATWEPDLWDRVRSNVHSAQYAAQVNAATLENVRLAQHAQLAMDYFLLRAQDSLGEVLDLSIASDQQTLDVTTSLVRAGLSNEEARSAIDAELHAARASREAVRLARAQYEDAIAVLVGQPPASVSLSVSPLAQTFPVVPAGLPATLLQRRPDIAGAERALAEANAQVGLSRSAYYPLLTLSAATGYQSLSVTDWVSWPNRVWAVGPSLVETVFDAGLRRAAVQESRARYDATLASYRQTVLVAFQEVEDNLAASARLRQQRQEQALAVSAAQHVFDEAQVRYKAGLDSYLNVLQAEQTLLTYKQAEVNLESQQLTATVVLIQSLGGGWTVQQLPAPGSMMKRAAP